MQETSNRAGLTPGTRRRRRATVADFRVTFGTRRRKRHGAHGLRPCAAGCAETGRTRGGLAQISTASGAFGPRRRRCRRAGAGIGGIRPPVPQSWRTGRTRCHSTRSTDYGTLRRTVRAAHTGSAGDHRTPGVAADPCGPRSVRGESRRGGEKPRGRNVPGEANPGIADPHTCVAEGAEEPQEGKSWILVILGPTLRTVP
jgi:hypothetical protein